MSGDPLGCHTRPWGGDCHWLLVGRGQGCCRAPCRAQGAPSRVTRTQVSAARPSGLPELRKGRGEAGRSVAHSRSEAGLLPVRPQAARGFARHLAFMSFSFLQTKTEMLLSVRGVFRMKRKTLFSAESSSPIRTCQAVRRAGRGGEAERGWPRGRTTRAGAVAVGRRVHRPQRAPCAHGEGGVHRYFCSAAAEISPRSQHVFPCHCVSRSPNAAPSARPGGPVSATLRSRRRPVAGY